MESDSENDSLEQPLTIEETVRVASLHTLPETSKKKYKTAYNLFIDWQKEQKITSFSETVLLDYFSELSTKFKSTTLWTVYSMLRTTINMNHSVDIANYAKLRAFLKSQSHGYRPKKSKTFTSSEINRFINEAPDNDYLLTKVALIMGVTGACRRHELHQMKVTNFNDFGTAVLVTIPNPGTKGVRKFIITERYYEIYKKYVHLRPADVNDSYFFLNYQKGKCNYQRVGINKFGAMGKEIAKYLQLPNPELYTGHCFRRSSATILGDDVTALRTFTERFIEEPVEVKQEADEESVDNQFEHVDSKLSVECDTVEQVDSKFNVANEILNSMEGAGNNTPSTSRTQTWENRDNLTFQLNSVDSIKMIFNNCTNITFNIVKSEK